MKNILIHHHDLVYRDRKQNIFLSSGIGRWVNSLAPHFKEIGLLLHESKIKNIKQTTQISQPNVKLISLGPPGYYIDYFNRINRIKKICMELKNWDILLIRGITPRQSTILNSVNVDVKAFFLIRSIVQNRRWSFNPQGIISNTVNIFREHQFKKIIKSKILLVSNSIENLEELQMKSSNEVYYVPTNIIMEKELCDINRSNRTNPKHILFVGRLNYMKGLRELIDALKILNKRNKKYHLNIVAYPTEPIFSELKKYSIDQNVDNSISWHGFIPFGEDLFSIYRYSDIFVLPSYTEGFPRVLWEAASNCCPIIVSDVGGVSNILTNHKNALLIKPKSVNSIVDAVCKLNDKIFRDNIIKNAHKIASDNTIEVSALKLYKIFNKGNHEN